MSDRLFTRNLNSKTKRIIAFCGSKQSGKNLAANFVGATLLYSYYFIESFQPLNDGIILNGIKQDINDIAPKFLKIYHWADYLKEFVSKVFDIDIKLLYGTDKDKEELTHLFWEDMPGVITNKKLYADVKRHIKKKGDLLGTEYKDSNFELMFHNAGLMSIRDILQFFGTDICRKIYSDCWISALKSTIIEEFPTVAIIADTRFDNEAGAVKEWGGKCIKLMRSTKTDQHSSEKGFSLFKDWDAVVQNQNTDNLPDFLKLLHKTIRPIGIFEEIS